MSMTVTEKDHFQTRLTERAEELQQAIINSDESWQRTLVKQAVELSEAHYGITPKLAELAQWEARYREAHENMERIRREILADMRGLLPEHVTLTSNNNRYYSQPRRQNIALPSPFHDDDFINYPHDVQNIIRSHAEFEYGRLLRAHPVGEQLTRLRDKYLDFKDRITACATHAQLSGVWAEVGGEFNIITEETRGRQLRKIETARNESAPTPKPRAAAKSRAKK